MDRGTFPADNQEAGLESDPANINGKYVDEVEVSDGAITVLYGNDAHATLSGQDLDLSPVTTGGSVTWICSSGTIADKHLPAACR